MTTVLLVRHGETPWNREKRIQGWAPVSLSERGREQAAAVAAHLATEYDVDRVVASDLRRTKETARVVARETGATTTFDGGWRERSFGVYQGLSYEDLFDGHPEFALGQVGYVAAEVEPESGESLLGARERVLDAFDRLLGETEGTAAVVTHGGPIRIVLGHLRDLDVVEAVHGLDVENCSITEFRADGDEVEIIEDCSVVREAPRAEREGRGTY
ncbi:histidine phosphatase family protein [Halobacteriales archaeon QS_1_68_20]|nr:MAG: histidine phosphatase family protein [Halobacteriales archaeon QS_1_68_20]